MINLNQEIDKIFHIKETINKVNKINKILSSFSNIGEKIEDNLPEGDEGVK